MTQMKKRTIAALAGATLALVAGAPAAAQAATSVSVTGGQLLVVDDQSSNVLTVADVSDPACPGGAPCYSIDNSEASSIVPTAPCMLKDPDPLKASLALCPAAGVSSVRMLGREGSDNLTVSDFAFGLGVPAFIEGGDGSDQITGTGQRDVIRGDDGYDDVFARGGDDDVSGGTGNDKIFGAKGNDRVAGGPGLDNLIGGLGNDRLFGQGGNDGMDGGAGKDYCDGGTGRDTPRNCEKRRATP